MSDAQARLTPRCSRCGRPRYDDPELGQLCGAALDALERMRLVVPGGVKVALSVAALEMKCRACACEVKP